ncbi:MAG: toxin-antitoxin system protein [Thermomicrobiales bacterium]
MATTTIRVSTDVRQRLAELAEAEGTSIGLFVQHLIEDHERRLLREAIAEDFRKLQADPEKWAFYQSEVALWDSALMDDLENEPSRDER